MNTAFKKKYIYIRIGLYGFITPPSQTLMLMDGWMDGWMVGGGGVTLFAGTSPKLQHFIKSRASVVISLPRHAALVFFGVNLT